MENLRLIIFSMLFCSGAIALSAQTTIPDYNLRELGLRLPDLQNFGFVYKKQKGPNRYNRQRLAVANIAFENISSTNSRFGFSLGYAFGTESREPLGEKLSFIYGPEPAFNFSFNEQGGVSRTIIRPIFGYVVGFQLNISDAFYLNIETIPSVRWDIVLNEGNRENTYGMFAGFASDALAVTLAYRFVPKDR